MQIDFIHKEELWAQVEEFRDTLSDAGRIIPINIFDIIEFELHIHLAPHPGLQDRLSAGAYLTVDCTEIHIDYDQFFDEIGPGYRRARFSGAVEVGHFVLHKEIIQGFDISSEENWKEFASTCLTAKYHRMSMQAIEFAGRLMVPKEALIKGAHQKIDLLSREDIKALPNNYKVKALALSICNDFELTDKHLQKRILNENILDEFF